MADLYLGRFYKEVTAWWCSFIFRNRRSGCVFLEVSTKQKWPTLKSSLWSEPTEAPCLAADDTEDVGTDPDFGPFYQKALLHVQFLPRDCLSHFWNSGFKWVRAQRGPWEFQGGGQHFTTSPAAQLVVPVPGSCPTLCNPMDCSTSGFPVLHYLPEFAQIHVCWVSNAI